MTLGISRGTKLGHGINGEFYSDKRSTFGPDEADYATLIPPSAGSALPLDYGKYSKARRRPNQWGCKDNIIEPITDCPIQKTTGLKAHDIMKCKWEENMCTDVIHQHFPERTKNTNTQSTHNMPKVFQKEQNYFSAQRRNPRRKKTIRSVPEQFDAIVKGYAKARPVAAQCAPSAMSRGIQSSKISKTPNMAYLIPTRSKKTASLAPPSASDSSLPTDNEQLRVPPSNAFMQNKVNTQPAFVQTSKSVTLQNRI